MSIKQCNRCKEWKPFSPFYHEREYICDECKEGKTCEYCGLKSRWIQDEWYCSCRVITETMDECRKRYIREGYMAGEQH